MTLNERAKVAAWIDDAYRHDFRLRMPPEIGALVGLALDDIEQLERSKRIIEGDYNKLHDELISAESDAREAVKTRDRLLARIERLETAIKKALGRISVDACSEPTMWWAILEIGLDSKLSNVRSREALATTAKEPSSCNLVHCIISGPHEHKIEGPVQNTDAKEPTDEKA